MKYVALLSGGKDSCYNLLHCAKNGHELVAAASLGPQPGKEELDSYLYQTVGQDAIEFVARALSVPLYRRVITGEAIEQGPEYGGRSETNAGGVDGDETEDLFTLLSTVKENHPDIQGVSVGAILSNYQRVRVEHVCRRLGLTTLAFLWQRDQGKLLSEMIDAGLEAIIIKVAGIGLTTKHLSQTLQNMEPTFTRLNTLYGSHICGEGGEYESLTLDCPLYKKKIVLKETEVAIHSDNSFATVAFLRIKEACLEDKPQDSEFHVTVPPLLEDKFISISDALSLSLSPLHKNHEPDFPTVEFDHSIQKQSDRKIGPWISITNVQSEPNNREYGIIDEVKTCFHLLRERLAQYNLQLSNCININIFLSSMDLFARVNAVYSTFFGNNPPARACVAVDLSSGYRVRLDCIALAEESPSDRQALHVQGLSYWAPANIGPYSQAIVANERIFVSGQIGLLPSTLSLPAPVSLAMETALAAQHASRIVDALKGSGGWDGHIQATLYWVASYHDLRHVTNIASKIIDSPTLFLQVKSLPKSALVEKQVLLHTGRCIIEDDMGGEPTKELRTPLYTQDTTVLLNDTVMYWQISSFEETTSACAIVCFKGGDVVPNANKFAAEFSTLLPRTLSVRLFHKNNQTEAFSSICDTLWGKEQTPPTTYIPCRAISTSHNEFAPEVALFSQVVIY